MVLLSSELAEPVEGASAIHSPSIGSAPAHWWQLTAEVKEVEGIRVLSIALSSPNPSIYVLYFFGFYGIRFLQMAVQIFQYEKSLFLKRSCQNKVICRKMGPSVLNCILSFMRYLHSLIILSFNTLYISGEMILYILNIIYKVKIDF